MLHILFPLGAPKIFALCWNSRFSVSSRFSRVLWKLWFSGSVYSGCARNVVSLLKLWVLRKFWFCGGTLGTPDSFILKFAYGPFPDVFPMREMLYILFPLGSPNCSRNFSYPVELQVIHFLQVFWVLHKFWFSSGTLGTPVSSIFKVAYGPFTDVEMCFIFRFL